MRLLPVLANVIFWLALTAWIGVLLTGGIAAGCVFGTLPSLGVHLTDYAAFAADAHGRLAAGMVMEKVFWVVDLVQFVAAPLAVTGFIVMLACGGWRGRRSSMIIAVLCLIAACATLAYHALVLAPPMNRELRAYWSAARAGEVDQAMARHQAFERMHPQAESLLQARLLLLLGALVAAAVAAAPTKPGAPGAPGAPRASALAQPSLLKP